MARYIPVKICKFSELEDDAKERAKQDYAAIIGYSWSEDALESLKALAKHFGGRLADYSIDWFNSCYSSATFDMPDASDIGNNNLPDHIFRAIGTSDATDDDVREAYEQWLKENLDALGEYDKESLKGTGECKLTGYCADEDAIDGFRIAFHKGERDLNALMDAAFDSWLKACQDDCEWLYKDEEFSEHCDANNYEFYEDGDMV